MNIKQLAEKLGLENDEYAELVELFITTAVADLAKLDSAVQTGDAEKAVQAAHSIKGAAGNLGLLEFYENVKKIEDDARQGILEGVKETIRSLRENLAKIKALVHG